MKKLVLIFLFSLLVTEAFCQRYQQWVFGSRSGFNFSSNPPKSLDSTAIFQAYPNISTSVCDSNGKMVFYTDGIIVWNGKGKIVERKERRWAWIGTAVSLLVPYTDNDSLYYLFGICDLGRSNKLLYMSLNAKGNDEKGSIVYPDPLTSTNYFTRLSDSSSMLLAGTLHCNRKDTWITTYYQQKMIAYLISKTGVSPYPVTSDIPIALPDIINGGMMRFSGNGEKVLIPMQGNNQVLIGSFNDLEGRFSEWIRLSLPDTLQLLEDAEFSPDGSKLYIASYSDDGGYIRVKSHNIFQMDLRAGGEEEILKSWTRINSYPDQSYSSPRSSITIERSFALAPDGRIYIGVRPDRPAASVIEDPNLAGLEANYKRNAIKLSRSNSNFYYNYIRTHSFSPTRNGIQSKRNNCMGEPVKFSLLYQKVDSVKWDFGDPQSGSANYSRDFETQHRYSDTGSYQVRAIIYHRCFIDTAKYIAVIGSDLPVTAPVALKDTALCVGQTLTVDASTASATSYKWMDNDGYMPVRKIEQSGVYEVMMRNHCSVASKQFTVKYDNCPCDVYLPNAFSPNNDGVNELFKPSTNCYTIFYKLVIYNRFGKEIYTTDNPSEGWNGRIGEHPQPTGLYVFTLVYRDPNTKKEFAKKGTIFLTR